MKGALIVLTMLGFVLFCYGIGCFDALGYEDVTAPALSAFTVTPTSLNTSAAPQTVAVDLTITDGLSGFQRGIICVIPPNLGSQTKFFGFDSAHRTTGTVNSGTYSVTLALPQYSQTGGWSLSYVELIDAVGNSRVIRRLDPAFGMYSTVTTF